MTINTLTNRVSFVGDASTTSFPVNFPFFDSRDLSVLVRDDTTGSVSTLSLGPDYSVTGGGGGTGTVNLNTPTGTGVTLFIIREAGLLQELDFFNNAPLNAEAAEDGLDRLTLFAQQVDDTLARSLRLPLTESGTNVIPPAADRRGKLLAFANTDTAEPIVGEVGNLDLSVAWGEISGSISSQSDLSNALGAKASNTDLNAHTGDATIHRKINDAGTTTTDLWSADQIASEDASVLSQALAGSIAPGEVSPADLDAVNASADGQFPAFASASNQFEWKTLNVSWGNISGTLSDQLDLQNELDAKADDSVLTSHTGDATIHRVINDAGATVTDLWSADKIGTELAAKVAAWGDITGTLANQTDLQTALDAKLAVVAPADINSTNSAFDGDTLVFDSGTGLFTWSAGLSNVAPADLDTTNLPADTQVPAFDSATGQFTWTDNAGTSSGVTTFTGLSDTPTSYPAGSADKFARVNATEDALAYGLPDWGQMQGTLSNQTDLQTALDAKLETVAAADLAATNSPADGQVVTFDSATGNFTWEASGTPSFTGLSDTPADYIGAGGQAVFVNSGASALEFVGDVALTSAPNTWTADQDFIETSTADPDTRVVTKGYVDGSYVSGAPTLYLGEGIIDPRLSTTNSGGTIFGPNGLLRAATTNRPRVTYDPVTLAPSLLVEPASTNELTAPMDFTKAAWTKSGAAAVTTTTESSPESSSGTVYVLAGSGSNDRLTDSNPVTDTGQDIPLSLICKAGTGDTIGFWMVANGGTTQSEPTTFDTTTETFTSSFSNNSEKAENLGDGWWRISGVLTLNGTGQTSYQLRIYVSSATTENIKLWHAQSEENQPAVTSPILVGGGTRTADDYGASGQDFTDLSNPNEGTVVVEWENNAPATGGETLFYARGASGDLIRLRNPTDNSGYRLVVLEGGVEQAGLGITGTIAGNITYRMAVAWKENAFAQVVNGGAVSLDTAGTVPALTNISFGESANVRIKTLAYYPKRLTNAELQALSVVGAKLPGTDGTAINRLDPHIHNETLHPVIDDAASNSTNTWSSGKIAAHTGDLSLHRAINDASTATTSLWSANKIDAEITTLTSSLGDKVDKTLPVITAGTSIGLPLDAASGDTIHRASATNGTVTLNDAPEGYQVVVYNDGGGTLTFQAATGQELRSPTGSSPVLSGGRMVAVVRVNGTADRWAVSGAVDGIGGGTSSTSVAWGDITGTLANQTDLQNALDDKTDITTFNSHAGDATIHRVIKDAGTTTADLWSASKIGGDLDGKADQTAFSAHTGDATIHRQINDANIGSTDLWSASKINTELQAVDTKWRQNSLASWGSFVEPLITDTWPAGSSFRVLETPQAGKGMVDLQYKFDGLQGSANAATKALNIRAEVNGVDAAVSGIGLRLVPKGTSDLSSGFNGGISSQVFAQDFVQSTTNTAAFMGLFSNVIGSRDSNLWNAVAMELNVTNINQDFGERWKAADFKASGIGGGGLTRIVVLKPESEFGGFTDPGFNIDTFASIGPTSTATGALVGAYGGFIFANDAIAADGTGIRLGGRTSAFTDAIPDTAFRIDKAWKKGISLVGATFTGPALAMSGGQEVSWNTAAGLTKLTANASGELVVTTPAGGTRVLAV